MLPASQAKRGEEKLRTILTQLASIRFRLNSLAVQMGLFSSLALIIAAAAVVFLAAWSLSPMVFLIAGGAAVLAAIIAAVFAIRKACRMRATSERAAALADSRAALKGRLETLLALQRADLRPPLFPYLVEDAMQRRADYAPSRIERRRISRSIFGLLAACILALLVTPLALRAHRGAMRTAAGNQPLTLNLRDLTIQPGAGAGRQGGSSVTGNPATMRKLARMMAQAEQNALNENRLAKMMKSAHDFAGRLQNKITGRHMPKPGSIRLADNGENSGTKSPSGAPSGQKNARQAPNSSAKSPGGSQMANSKANQGGSGKQMRHANPGNRNPGALAMQGPLGSQSQSIPPVNGSGSDTTANVQSSNRDSGSSSHGAGADPNGLFGAPDRNLTSDGNYQIAIAARPNATGDGAGNGAYPPKVNAALNRQQHPDEPISRATVPARDRTTIKRIFER